VSRRRETLLALLLAIAGAAVHLFLLPASARERSDLPLYLDSALRWASGEVPYREIPFEYPPAALLLLRVPLEAAAALGSSFERAFAGWMALFDALALFSAYLCCRGRRGFLALGAGFLGLALCASVLHTRFDLAPGALMALSVALGTMGALPWAGAALGAAVALKLYPLAIAPAAAVFVYQRGGKEALRKAILAGSLAIAALSFPAALGAGASALSFFGYHYQRGVQIQSLWGALLLCLGRLHGEPVPIVHAFGAEQLEGSFPLLARLSLCLQLAAGLGAAWAVWRRASLSRAALGAFAGFVAFGKVGSPQFLLALVPLAACAAGAADASALVALVLAGCALMAWEFPRHYGALFHNQGPWAAIVLLRMLLFAAVSIAAARPRLRAKLPR